MKQLLKIGGYVGTVGAVVLAVWGAFAFYDGLTDGQDEILQQVEYINIEQRFMAEDIMMIKDSLKNFETKMDQTNAAVYTTNKLMRYEREHRDEFSQDQMNEILIQMEELLKKKTPEIVYTPPG